MASHQDTRSVFHVIDSSLMLPAYLSDTKPLHYNLKQTAGDLETRQTVTLKQIPEGV